MKTSAFHALASAAACFVMCASVTAAGPKPSVIRTACLKCHGGGSVNGDLDFTRGLTIEQKRDAIAKAATGEMPMNGPRLTPAQFSQLKIELGVGQNAGASSAQNGAPPASPRAKRSAPNSRSLTGTVPGASFNPAATATRATASRASAAKSRTATPQGRNSVVSSTPSSSSDSSTVPTARVRVVPHGLPRAKSVAAARVAVISTSDDSTAAVVPPRPVETPAAVAAVAPNASDSDKSLEAASSGNEDSSKISDSIKGLVGDWMAVSRQGDGELSTVELQLDDHGWAKLTVPGADGKPSTTTRKVDLKDDQLTLTSKSGVVSLGKLLNVDSRQMVLERETGLVTFVRP